MEARLQTTTAAAEEKLVEEAGAGLAPAIEQKQKQTQKAPNLEHEIECPRCHDVMSLCSDFDSLYYSCEECDFCLYTIVKRGD